MSDFTTDVPTTTVTDLYKRVRYTTGLVLGVDEFDQEQAYFIERDRLLTRALHGYGVVHGLRVHVDRSGDAPKLMVDPGLAVDPCGQHVCIGRAQCAILDDWLAQQTAADLLDDGEDPTEICLSVVLRYGACETDFVPVAGSPCRSAEDTRVPSRLADDFRLTIERRPDAPPQVEERAIRLLGRLLRAFAVRPSGPYVSADDLAALLGAVPTVVRAAEASASPSLSDLADEAGVSLPTDDEGRLQLRIEPDRDVAALLRRINGLWVTQVRPDLLTTGHGEDPLQAGGCGDGTCQPVPRGDDGVVLGTLCIDVAADGDGGVERTTSAEDLAVTTEDRSTLLASRVLQEATGLFARSMENGGIDGIPAGGDLDGTYPNPEVIGLRGEPLSMDPDPDDDSVSLADGQVLTYDGSTWRPQPLPEEEPSPEPEPPPTNAETGLTRIVATNWPHGGEVAVGDGALSLALDVAEAEAQEVQGLAVAFGAEAVAGPATLAIGSPGSVVRAGLTPDTFRVSAEAQEGQTPRLLPRLAVEPAAVLPLANVDVDANGRITGGFVDVQEATARGVVFVLAASTIDALLARAAPRIDIALYGDAILDSEGRAVDAELVRGRLPSGDRPEGGTVGVQGGRFESWILTRPGIQKERRERALQFVETLFEVDLPREIETIDLNTASEDVLTALPNVGEAIAGRIRAFIEEEGAIDSPLQLVEVQGLTETRIREWAGQVDPPLPS